MSDAVNVGGEELAATVATNEVKVPNFVGKVRQNAFHDIPGFAHRDALMTMLGHALWVFSAIVTYELLAFFALECHCQRRI